jgi:hypothetical protein
MTTKLKFIESACHVFNCTPATVLAAVSCRPIVHPELAVDIRRWARNSCNATQDEWKAFDAACGEFGYAILDAITSGSEVKTPEAYTAKNELVPVKGRWL